MWNNDYLVTRVEILAHPTEFPIISGQTLTNDNKIVSNSEARAKICCDNSELPSNTSKVPIFQEFVRVYAHSLRFGATCAAACSAGYNTYYSPCSTLAVNCMLYLECSCISIANAGYYLNSSENCHQFNGDLP